MHPGAPPFSAFSRFAFEVPALKIHPEKLAEPAFDWGFDLEVPYELLAVYVRHLDSAAPLARVPLFALARFGLSEQTRRELEVDATAVESAFPLVPLGVVGTDHVGYGSFDLSSLRQVEVAEAIRLALKTRGLLEPGKPDLTVELEALLVLPYKDPAFAFDALVEGDVGSNLVCLRMDLDATMLDRREDWPAMPAMQTPGIRDWRLSPGSFSMSGALVIGQDGCETLVPSNLATRLVRFRQVARTAKTARVKPRDRSVEEIPGHGIGLTGQARLGYTVEYHTEWFPIGHSLGQIAYSLPLAPGERMQVAVVDWSRRETAKRTEQTSETEDLQHAALRDRSLTEAVHMVVKETQSGSSLMAGGAVSAGAGIPIGPVSIGIGSAGSVGGSTSHTEGMRSLVGDTSQQISDAFHQASTAARELNSTVVVQGEQAEASKATTRVVANHNHSHALTILYYEVLQHQRVLTRVTAVKPALLLQQKTNELEDETIDAHLATIDAHLLDESLRPCLAVLRELVCRQAKAERDSEQLAEAALHQLSQFTVELVTGANGPTHPVSVRLIPKSGPPVDCDLVHANLAAAGPDPLRQISPAHIKPNARFTTELRPSNYLLRWQNVVAIEIRQNKWNVFAGGSADWDLAHLRVTTAEGADAWTLYDGGPNGVVPLNGSPIRFDVVPFERPAVDAEDQLDDEKRCCLRRLRAHLKAHAAHYWRAIWLAENDTDRAARLDGWELAGQPLRDVVENRLLDVVGDELVLPLATNLDRETAKEVEDAFKVTDALDPPAIGEYVEQLLTVPARGVFAEAKLGHCNASELEELGRRWDWNVSPIPEGPAIAPVSAEGDAKDLTDATKPTAFPAAMVNIVSPQALPDATGFTSGAQVLAALGQFRDMSGLQQVSQLLQTLSNNATQLAAKGLDNAQVAGLVNTIRNTKELTPQEKTELIGALMAGQVKKTAASTPAGDKPASSGGDKATAATTASEAGKAASTSAAAKPQQAATPQRAGTTSPKVKLLIFTFKFESRDEMFGRWFVRLSSGGEDVNNGGFVSDSVHGISGASVGNRVLMEVPASFGSASSVQVDISGTIVAPTQILSSPGAEWEIQGWQHTRDFSATILRPDYDKADTIEVVQATVPAEFTATLTREKGHTDSEVSSPSQGLTVGAEVEAQAGASIPKAEAKDRIRVSADGSFGWTSPSQKSTAKGDAWTEQVEFTGFRLDSSAPTIKALT